MSYIIEEIKCGITEGGIACGPIDGNIVVSLKFSDGDQTKWLNNVEVAGIPNFYLTDKDIYEELLKEDFDNEEFTRFLDNSFVSNFVEIKLGEYEDIYESFTNANPDNVKLIRAIIWVTRCDMSELEKVISYLTKTDFAEIDIPILDVEDDFYSRQD